MLELTSPGWLLGLGLIPLVRWVHRFRHLSGRQPVSAAFLWRRLDGAETPGPQRSELDPRWRTRALIVGSIFLALAGPRWSGHSTREVEIWFDDSLSMWSREAGRTRIETAYERLLQALRQEGVGDYQVRSLTRPEPAFPSRATDQREILRRLSSPGTEPAGDWMPAPSPAPIERWLVTDGAYDGMTEWVSRARPSRVIRVGKARENCAVTTLSLRRSLERPDHALGWVAVANLGEQPSSRELRLLANDRERFRWRLQIPSGSLAERAFEIPVSELATVSTRLVAPAHGIDPLPLDDSLDLRLPVRGWRYPVGVSGVCPSAVLAALEAIAPIATVAEGTTGASATVTCANRLPAGTRPTLWLGLPTNSQPLGAAPVWHPSAGALADVMIDSSQLAADPKAPPLPGQPVLSAGQMTLIALQRRPHRQVSVALDPTLPGLGRSPELPLLMSGLLTLVLDRPLSGEILSRERDPSASRIAARPVPELRPPSHHQRTARTTPAVGWLLSTAVLLLVLDTLRLFLAGKGPGRSPAATRLPS